MYDEQIEKLVLYYIIYEKKDLQVDEKDFINNRNKLIIKAIIELKKENNLISVINIQNKIKANKKEVIKYLASLGNDIAIYGTNAQQCFNQLKEMTKKRKVFNIAKDILNNIEDQEDINVYIQDCIKNISSIYDGKEEDKALLNQVVDTVAEIENNYKNRGDKSLYTGIFDLDSMTGGLHRNEFTIVGARPRTRKNYIGITNWRKDS